MPLRLSNWWRRLDDRGRRHATLLAAIAVGYIVHYLVYCLPQPFYIEDAGISFTYARNLVHGEGLVTYPGGERVEGYSNALWTFLVAAFYALGVSPWTSSKILGAVFGVLTLPVSYLLVREARPRRTDGTEPPDDVALVAPAMLAASTQFVIWNASGLENSLYCLLLAAGTWRLVREVKADTPRGRRPWSAVLFFLLTATRPDGLMYAVLALAGRLMASVAQARTPSKRPWRSLVLWVAFFIVPWTLYNGWRIWYFAWFWPNTYYAKLGKGNVFHPFNWNAGGWRYVKNWFAQHGIVYMVPLFGAAALGRGRRGRRLAYVLIPLLAVLAGMVFWNGRTGLHHIPDWWQAPRRHWTEIRVWALLCTGVLLGLATLGRPGWLARGLLWGEFCSGVFFAVYVNGDWMKAWRFFSPVTVSAFPLAAIGLGEILDAIPVLSRRPARWWPDRLPVPRHLLIAIPLVVFVGDEVAHANRFAQRPETAVRDVHRRVRYMTWVQHRLDLDHVTLLDVDMGAHMWFSGWDIVDIAGLVDVPMGHHQDFNKKFIQQYIFEERKPDFAHVHGGWARTSKIPEHADWKKEYLEIPGYPIGGRQLHVGNHIRKDLFVHEVDDPQEGWSEADRFEGGIGLMKWSVPSAEVAPGGQLFLDTTWAAGFRKDGFRILAALDDGKGHRTVAALAPGYDWYKPEDWKPTERVEGRYYIPIPAGLPQGTYRLSIVLLDEASGKVLAWIPSGTLPAPPEPEEASATDITGPPATEPAPARTAHTIYMPGERVLPVRVKLVSPPRAIARAQADEARALAQAKAGDCDEAWLTFKNATRHIHRNTRWAEEHAPAIHTAIARCWVARADELTDRAARIAALIKARRWDHRLQAMLDRSRPLAAILDREGDQAFAAHDWSGAYQAWATAMKLDPTRSWTRRKTEEARDLSLGITRPGWKKPTEGRAPSASATADARPRPPGMDGLIERLVLGNL